MNMQEELDIKFIQELFHNSEEYSSKLQKTSGKSLLIGKMKCSAGLVTMMALSRFLFFSTPSSICGSIYYCNFVQVLVGHFSKSSVRSEVFTVLILYQIYCMCRESTSNDEVCPAIFFSILLCRIFTSIAAHKSALWYLSHSLFLYVAGKGTDLIIR